MGVISPPLLVGTIAPRHGFDPVVRWGPVSVLGVVPRRAQAIVVEDWRGIIPAHFRRPELRC